ncbi:MAG: DUF4115 domain-containing protein [Proteobacteria bacterium]|nr:DUF4115 domain-containing protein [Pseudomonadota bacterium]
MSKRKHKHKNKYRSDQRSALPGGAVEEQAQLPLPPVPGTGIEAAQTIALPVADHATPPAFDAPAGGNDTNLAEADPMRHSMPTATLETAIADPISGRDPAPAVIPADASLGQRLRATREARGLSREAAARALKLPVAVVIALEAEQYDRIGHGVFLRGFLGKYLELLDLPRVLADRVVLDHAELPPLTTHGTVSHPRYLFERYSGSALYLILTGVIVVPAVLLAIRAGFDQNLTRITPLDFPAATLAPVPSSHDAASPRPPLAALSAQATPTLATAPSRAEESALVASMTPFPATSPDSKSRGVAASQTANRIQLQLTQPSWVEVVDAGGRKLEYGLLPAGSEREYASDSALEIRIGNADGATLRVDGKLQDLTAYRHANVAHLKVEAGSAMSVHGG